MLNFLKIFLNFNFLYCSLNSWSDSEPFRINDFCDTWEKVFKSEDFERWFLDIFWWNKSVISLFNKFKQNTLSKNERDGFITFLNLKNTKNKVLKFLERLKVRISISVEVSQDSLDELFDEIESVNNWKKILQTIFKDKNWVDILISEFQESIKKSVSETI